MASTSETDVHLYEIAGDKDGWKHLLTTCPVIGLLLVGTKENAEVLGCCELLKGKFREFSTFFNKDKVSLAYFDRDHPENGFLVKVLNCKVEEKVAPSVFIFSDGKLIKTIENCGRIGIDSEEFFQQIGRAMSICADKKRITAKKAQPSSPGSPNTKNK